MKYKFIGLSALLLVGCGSSDGDGDTSEAATQITADELRKQAISVDGYKQMTVSADSNLKLVLGDGEVFTLKSSDSAEPEKLLVKGKLTITSN